MFRKAAVLFMLLFSILNTTALAAPVSLAEDGGNPWWLWLIVFAVVALFVGFMLWWWLREPEEEEETTPVRHDQAGVYDAPDTLEAAVEHGQVVAAHIALQDTAEIPAAKAEITEPQVVAPDDLTIVEGIGPAIQKVLYAAGINTYRDLAAADPARLEAILEEADSKLARLFDPTTWPEQAQLAAVGNWEELKDLKDRLSAGRRV